MQYVEFEVYGKMLDIRFKVTVRLKVHSYMFDLRLQAACCL